MQVTAMPPKKWAQTEEEYNIVPELRHTHTQLSEQQT